MSKREEAFKILDEVGVENITSTELAERVGYASRSGGYKAIKKYKEMNNNNEQQEQQDRGRQENNDSNEHLENDRELNDGDIEQSARQNSSGIQQEQENPDDKSNDHNQDKRQGDNGNTEINQRNDGGNTEVNIGDTGGKDAKPDIDGDSIFTSPDGVDDDISADEWDAFSQESKNKGVEDDIKDDVGETSEEETKTQETINAADTEEERQRREEVVNKLENNTFETPEGAGLEVDTDVLKELFGMPYSATAEMTGYDKWELTESEKETNAKLLEQYMRENNIDPSTGTLLAFSILQTTVPRAVGYKRHKDQNTHKEDKKTPKTDNKDEEEQDTTQEEKTASSDELDRFKS